MNRIQAARTSKRSGGDLSLSEYIQLVGGSGFAFPLRQTLVGKTEIPDNSYSYAGALYRSNPIVFATMEMRRRVFSQARFQFRRLRDGKPGDLFGNRELRILEKPWPNGTTGELRSRMLQDVDLDGNSFIARRKGEDRVRRLRPDWVTIVLGSKVEPVNALWQLDAEIVGYIYEIGGPGSKLQKPHVLLPSEVAHWSPLPDPWSPYRGMSWLTPVIRDVLGDKAATEHKLKFFENGGTPNMVVSMDPSVTIEQFKAFKTEMDSEHRGYLNAYKTLYLGGGAKVDVVGKDFRQLDFKLTQGGGETRIAAAGGVPPGLAGFSEGIAANTYSNLSQARRIFTDGTCAELWASNAGALAPIINVPSDGELWFDATDIPFLREDAKDVALILAEDAKTIRYLVEAGYEPGSVVAAVTNRDFTLLKHTGLFSIQLQPPGTEAPPAPAPAP